MLKKVICLTVAALIITLCAPTHCAGAYSASAIAVYEPYNSSFLESENGDTRLPMASTTKIMTAIVTLENIDLEEQIKIPDVAVGIEGSSMYLSKDETLSVKELVYGLMLTSGNDAAMALAYTVGNSSIEKFVSLMNDKAKAIGLENTRFTNPSGLPDDEHYTTAKELAILTAYALENPAFAQIVSTRSIKIRKNGTENGRYLKNHNKMLFNYDGAIGVKTGFTKKAGRCLVSAATRDGVTLVCVTLNAPNDWQDHTEALDKGFGRTGRVTLLKEGEIKLPLKTPDGSVVYAQNKKSASCIVIDGNLPQKSIIADKFVYAPKNVGDTVGKVSFQVDGREVAGAELCLVQAIEAPIRKELFITVIIKFIRNLF